MNKHQCLDYKNDGKMDEESCSALNHLGVEVEEEVEKMSINSLVKLAASDCTNPWLSPV